MQLGNALGTLHLLHLLTDRVRLADPEDGLLVTILLYTLGMVATATVGGRLSTAAPQVPGPALAAPIVTHPGGYPTLYAVTAAVTLLGAVLVTRIRSVP